MNAHSFPINNHCLLSVIAFLQALKDTVIVVAVVATSAIVLFGLNTGLTELANLFYGLLAKAESRCQCLHHVDFCLECFRPPCCCM